LADIPSLYQKLGSIASKDFSDIVDGTEIMGRKSAGSSKLRIRLKDGTFIDVWLSSSGKYSYHWEQRAKRGLIHRHDNAPDFPDIATFPKHFHDGNEETVTESRIPEEPEEALREFLKFVKERMGGP
jgi:hypothetical protein